MVTHPRRHQSLRETTPIPRDHDDQHPRRNGRRAAVAPYRGRRSPTSPFFDRFAIGEWASKHALEDLTPMSRPRMPGPEPHRSRRLHPWAIEEASYRPPGSIEPRCLYGILSVVDARMLYTNLDLCVKRADRRGGEPKIPRGRASEDGKRLSRHRVPGAIAVSMARF